MEKAKGTTDSMIFFLFAKSINPYLVNCVFCFIRQSMNFLHQLNKSYYRPCMCTSRLSRQNTSRRAKTPRENVAPFIEHLTLPSKLRSQSIVLVKLLLLLFTTPETPKSRDPSLSANTRSPRSGRDLPRQSGRIARGLHRESYVRDAAAAAVSGHCHSACGM